MKHYYNEIDPVAAQWLRNLIAAGELPPGDVDERSIEDVLPADLDGYVQCHFFAGIGGWPLALRLAGWPVEKPIWTGSCPCQPFSAAGKGDGFADERHLWPSFHWLIQQRRPAIVAGEQVASAAVGPWIDLVLTDLEALGYACGAYAGPAAGVGAPHLRDRSYWVGYSGSARGALGLSAPTRRHEGLAGIAHDAGGQRAGAGPRSSPSGTGCGVAGGMADASGERLTGEHVCVWPETAGRQQADLSEVGRGCGTLLAAGQSATTGDDGWMAYADGGQQRQAGAVQSGGEHGLFPQDRGDVWQGGSRARPRSESGLWVSDPLAGHWRGADWLLCRDVRWRPVEPGSFPLAHGIPGRVGRLRGYGNAIVPQQAAEFIKAVM